MKLKSFGGLIVSCLLLASQTFALTPHPEVDHVKAKSDYDAARAVSDPAREKANEANGIYQGVVGNENLVSSSQAERDNLIRGLYSLDPQRYGQVATSTNATLSPLLGVVQSELSQYQSSLSAQESRYREVNSEIQRATQQRDRAHRSLQGMFEDSYRKLMILFPTSVIIVPNDDRQLAQLRSHLENYRNTMPARASAAYNEKKSAYDALQNQIAGVQAVLNAPPSLSDLEQQLGQISSNITGATAAVLGDDSVSELNEQRLSLFAHLVQNIAAKRGAVVTLVDTYGVVPKKADGSVDVDHFAKTVMDIAESLESSLRSDVASFQSVHSSLQKKESSKSTLLALQLQAVTLKKEVDRLGADLNQVYANIRDVENNISLIQETNIAIAQLDQSIQAYQFESNQLAQSLPYLHNIVTNLRSQYSWLSQLIAKNSDIAQGTAQLAALAHKFAEVSGQSVSDMSQLRSLTAAFAQGREGEAQAKEKITADLRSIYEKVLATYTNEKNQAIALAKTNGAADGSKEAKERVTPEATAHGDQEATTVATELAETDAEFANFLNSLSRTTTTLEAQLLAQIWADRAKHPEIKDLKLPEAGALAGVVDGRDQGEKYLSVRFFDQVRKEKPMTIGKSVSLNFPQSLGALPTVDSADNEPSPGLVKCEVSEWALTLPTSVPTSDIMTFASSLRGTVTAKSPALNPAADKRHHQISAAATASMRHPDFVTSYTETYTPSYLQQFSLVYQQDFGAIRAAAFAKTFKATYEKELNQELSSQSPVADTPANRQAFKSHADSAYQKPFAEACKASTKNFFSISYRMAIADKDLAAEAEKRSRKEWESRYQSNLDLQMISGELKAINSSEVELNLVIGNYSTSWVSAFNEVGTVVITPIKGTVNGSSRPVAIEVFGGSFLFDVSKGHSFNQVARIQGADAQVKVELFFKTTIGGSRTEKVDELVVK